MRQITTILALSIIAVFSSQCDSNPSGTTISGQLQNAPNMQVFLDYVMLNKPSDVLTKAETDASGNFQLELPDGVKPGVYQFRIGAKSVNLVMDGSEKKVVLQGDLTSLQNYQFTVSGSKDSQILANLMSRAFAQQVGVQDIVNFVDTVSNATLGAFVAYRTLGNNAQFLDLQKKAQQRLAAQDPSGQMTQEYANFITAVEQQYQAQMASEVIRVGQEAPNITLPNPNGKPYSLSDLRGKVVLLDFWASWCGPCRRENPNVVKVYDRYKDQGFTVFSVSLDGLDSRTAARFNEEQRSEFMAQQKTRWVDAIKQDNLKWEYHVSDLKKWECAPAATYGVTSIPRTFLIDREGKIAAINLRGAEHIEMELKKLL